MKEPIVVIRDRRKEDFRDFDYDLELHVWRNGDDAEPVRFVLAQYNGFFNYHHGKQLVERVVGILTGRE